MQPIYDRIPPQALEAEEALIGSLLVDSAHMPAILEHVSPPDFYAHVHDTIFAAMMRLHAESKPLDKISVVEELRRRGDLETVGGIAYLSRMMDTVQTASSAVYYAKVIREKSILRGLIAAGSKISEIGYSGEDDVDSSIADSEKALSDALQRSAARDDGRQADVIGGELYKQLVGGVKAAQTTPWPTLNRFTGGFYPGEFIGWPAAPKMGKSALISQLADHLSTYFGRILYFPLEMGAETTVRRLLATYSAVTSRRQRSGDLQPIDYDCLLQANDVLRTRNLKIYGRGKSVADIRRITQREASEGKVAAVIVDHPGFLKDLDGNSKTSKHERLDQVYRQLLDLADAEKVVMHVVQHVNREGMKGEPTLANIRDGGNIEGHAHVIISPYRALPYGTPDEQRDGKFIILANRDGEAGTIPVEFIGSRHLWLEKNQEIPNFLQVA